MQRSRRLRGLFALSVILLLVGSVFPTRPTPTKAAPSDQVVERWSGSLEVQSRLNFGMATFGTYPGYINDSYTLKYNLQVYEDGFLNGDVYATLHSASFEQEGDTCLWFFVCQIAVGVSEPSAHVFVEGSRYGDAEGKPAFKITKILKLDPAYLQTSAQYGTYPAQTDTAKWWPSVFSPYTITILGNNRYALAQLSEPNHSDEFVSYTHSGYLVGVGTEPFLELDPELLEDNIFVEQIPINDQFDANVNWNSVSGGWVDWKVAQKPAERVGPTKAPVVKKDVNAGLPSPGKQTVVAQAHTPIGGSSPPEAVQVIAGQLKEWCGGGDNVTGQKDGLTVIYRCNYKFPEPSFKANVNVPSFIPFFGGNTFGIRETQALVGAEFRSTGQGYARGEAQTGFEAMGDAIYGKIQARAQIELDESGFRIPSGDIELKMGGKIKAEEPLLKVIPQAAPIVTALEKFSPAAAKFMADKAKAKLEIEPSLTLPFKFKATDNDVEWFADEAKPAIGFKALVEIKFTDDIVTSVGIGGEAALTLKVPGPHFKQLDLKFLVIARARFKQFLNAEYEKSWNLILGNKPAAATAPLSGTSTVATGWQVMDRSYLNDRNYAHWVSDAAVQQPSLVAGTPTRYKQLVQNVFPLAQPSIVLENPAGSSEKTWMVWSHDKPNSPALSGQELMFARSGGDSASWCCQTQLTNDNRADLEPKMLRLNDGTALIVWQRLDTSTPGDFNVDPASYLQHLQIAATPYYPGSSALPTPQQLSASGSMNYGHQIGALSNGALAVWVNNQSNQIIGDAAHPDRIMFARYTTATKTWTAATPALANVAGLMHMHLATSANGAALVYEQDTDGDFGTDADRELFMMQLNNGTWSAPTRLTTNTVADVHPQVTLSTTGTPVLVWQQNGQNRWLAGSWNAASTVLNMPNDVDLQMIASQNSNHAALVWQQPGAVDTDIGYSLYDAATNTWSVSQTMPALQTTGTVTGSAHMATNISAALATEPAWIDKADARLYLGYQVASVQAITRTIDGIDIPNVPELGNYSLNSTQIKLGTNLTITPADLSVMPSNAQPNQPIKLYAQIRNTGDLPVKNVPVQLQQVDTEQMTTVVASKTLPLLAAGASYTMTFDLQRPAIADTRWVVRVNPPDQILNRALDEIRYNDNDAILGSGMSVHPGDIYYTPRGTVLGAKITQYGMYTSGIYTSSLHLNAPDGPIVAEIHSVFPVTPTATIQSTAWFSATELGFGDHTVYWNLDPNNKAGDHDLSDNTFAANVRIYPDLATDGYLIGFGKSPGASAPISLRVINQGSWQSAASSVAVYDGDPALAGTHEIGRFAIPALAVDGYAEINGTLNLAGLPAATTGLEMIYVVIDPDNQLTELSEANNIGISGGLLAGALPETTTYNVYVPLVQR